MFPLRETAARPFARTFPVQLRHHRRDLARGGCRTDRALHRSSARIRFHARTMSSSGSAIASSGSIFCASRMCRRSNGRRRWRSIDKSEREPREKTARATRALWPRRSSKSSNGGGRSEKLDQLVEGSARIAASAEFVAGRSPDRARARLLHRRGFRSLRSRRQAARDRRRRTLRQSDRATQRRCGLIPGARLCHGRCRSGRADSRDTPQRATKMEAGDRARAAARRLCRRSPRKSVAPMRSRRSRRCATRGYRVDYPARAGQGRKAISDRRATRRPASRCFSATNGRR